MSRMQRDKGRKAEAAVRDIYAAHGFEVRGLEASGDHLAVGHGLTIHSEVKRQEVLRLPLWARQAEAEAPAGALVVVAFRRSREVWQAITPEAPVAGYLFEAGLIGGIHYSLFDLGGTWWVRLPLAYLLETFAFPAAATAPLAAS